MPRSARSIATLSLTFGLVSIPVKVYSATESASAIRFRLMAAGGARVRQQYVADAPPLDVEDAEDMPRDDETGLATAPPPRRTRAQTTEVPERADGAVARTVVDFPARRTTSAAAPPPEEPEEVVIDRTSMVKGYEFEKGRFVLFTPDELKALQDASRQTIDIVSFIPERGVDPIYYDKAYFLAPDRRGSKPYHLLLRAMRETGRSALAKWAFRAKEYVVQIRAAEGGMVLQQLLYADEVRSLADLEIEEERVGDAELELAKRLIAQTAEAAYDPHAFVDEEKQRIRAAIEEKIAGRQVVVHGPDAPAATGAQVVDLIEALRARLKPPARDTMATKAGAPLALAERKPVKRAAPTRRADAAASPAAPARKRPGKR